MKTRVAKLVKAYLKGCFRKKVKEEELTWFKYQPSFAKAIEKAALAERRNGGRFSHQRMKRSTLEKAKAVLLSKEMELKKCGSFNDLLILIEDEFKKRPRPVSGLGELYYYDTAFRLGIYRNLYPKKIYLHRGTRIGAKRLGLIVKAQSRSIETQDIRRKYPILTKYLRPYEIEDFLCIYKDCLGKGRKGSKKLPSCLRCTTKLIHHKIPE